MPVVGGGQDAFGQGMAGPGAAGLRVGEVGEAYAGRKVPLRVAVQQLLREVRALPVLLPARHHQPRPRLRQPLRRALRPLGEAVGQDRGHLLGAVEEEEQGAACGAGETGQAFGGEVAQVGGGGIRGGRHDPGGPGERSARRVGHRGVGVLEVGAAQPEGGGRGGAPVAAGGEGRELCRTAAAGRSDEAEDAGRALGESGELPGDRGPFDRLGRICPARVTGERARRTVLAHGGGRQFQHAGEVEVGAVRRDRRRVLREQVAEGAGPDGAERDRVSAVAVAALQGGAEDGDHRAGLGVEHGASGGPAAQPQGVPSRGADRQLQDVFEEMEAVGGGVGHGGRAEHPGLAPAAGGEPDVGAGLDGVAHGHGQRVHAEPFGTDERQVELGERGHGIGGHHAAAVTAGVQHEPGRPVDGLMAGDDGATMIGHEPDPPGPAGQIKNPHEFPVPPGPGSLPALPGTLLAPAPPGPYGIAGLAIATPIGRPGLADLPIPLPHLTIGGPGAPRDLPVPQPSITIDTPGTLTDLQVSRPNPPALLPRSAVIASAGTCLRVARPEPRVLLAGRAVTPPDPPTGLTRLPTPLFRRQTRVARLPTPGPRRPSHLALLPTHTPRRQTRLTRLPLPKPRRPTRLPRDPFPPPRHPRTGAGGERRRSVGGVTFCRHGRTSPPYARSCCRR